MIGKLGQIVEERDLQIKELFELSKEVHIGKRNINCLSCSKQPNLRPSTGMNGRIYHGSSLSAAKDKNTIEDEDATGVKKLLNMKWDHLGLKNYKSTIDVIGKLGGRNLRRGSTGKFGD